MDQYIPEWRNNRFVHELEAAADKMGDGWNDAFVVYAILDPTLRDPERRYGEWMPIYVGQTNYLRRRIIKHFRSAEWCRSRPHTIRTKLSLIMQRYKIPQFIVLMEYGSRLEALKGETMWAQKLSQEGYTLANRYYDQRQRRSPKYVRSALLRKAYALRLNEAINAGVTAKYHCSNCQFEQSINLYALRDRLQLPAIKLTAALRDRPWCRRCRTRLDYQLNERVDANHLVPDFAIKMPLPQESRGSGSYAMEPEDDIGDNIPAELFENERERLI